MAAGPLLADHAGDHHRAVDQPALQPRCSTPRSSSGSPAWPRPAAPSRRARSAARTRGSTPTSCWPGSTWPTAARAAAKEAVEAAGRHESTRLNRYLGTLGTVAGISPLLGLLGTVTGMIEVFNTIAEAGAGQAAQLSSGISQALITTATGLLIAIPALVAHNFFHEKADAIVADLEQESLRVLRGLYYTPPPGGSHDPDHRHLGAAPGVGYALSQGQPSGRGDQHRAVGRRGFPAGHLLRRIHHFPRNGRTEPRAALVEFHGEAGAPGDHRPACRRRQALLRRQRTGSGASCGSSCGGTSKAPTGRWWCCGRTGAPLTGRWWR